MVNSVAKYLARSLLKVNPKSRLATTKTSTMIDNYCKMYTSMEPARTLPPGFDTDYQDVKPFKQFLDESSLGTTAASTLIKVAGIPRNVASEVVKDFNKFEQLSKSNIVKNYEILLEAGISREQIMKHPYVLADHSDGLLIKLVLFNQMKLDLNKGIRLFQIPVRRVPRYLIAVKNDREIIPEFNNRIEYLASKLESDVEEMCDKVCNNPQFFNVSMERIVELTNLLLDGGMNKKILRGYLYLYSINYDKIKRRIKLAKELKIYPLTPWVVRSPEYCFADFVRRHKMRMAIEKPYERVNEYAMTLFNCSAADIESLYKRDPRLHSMSKKIIYEMFTLLHELGYTLEEIFVGTRCFHCSTKSLREKYDTWVKNGLGHPHLAIISSANNMYQKWLKERTDKKTD